MIRNTTVGEVGCDFSYGKNMLTEQYLAARNMTYAFGYLTGCGDPRKTLDVANRTRLLDAGFGVGIIWQESTLAARLSVEAARVAVKTLNDEGWPKELPLIVAVDHKYIGDVADVTHLRVFKDALAADGRAFGAYASANLLAIAKPSCGILPASTYARGSAGEIAMAASLGVVHAQQFLDAAIADRLVTINPFPVWVKDQPVPVGGTMSNAVIVKVEGFNNRFLVGDGGIIYLTPELYAHYKATCVEIVQKPHPMFMEYVRTQIGHVIWTVG